MIRDVFSFPQKDFQWNGKTYEIAVNPNSQSFLHSNSEHEHVNQAPLLLVQHTQPSKQYDWTHRLAAQADTCAVW